MRVMAQMGMVMNLDKCIGCHTCSVTCKQAWTNRSGVEYVWFNNVETRPGQGYPRRYQDQERWKGGWVRNRRGRLTLKAGGRFKKLLTIFANPVLPNIRDYYEPWTYDYEKLTDAPLGDDFPVAQPKSLLSGEPMAIEWSANWDDDLGGAPEHGPRDPIVERLRRESEDAVRFSYEQAFMFFLPRICEHCLNPSCVASCPSGAMYKRAEDGIVLVDQDQCRGWRMCVTGCPYKKVYFNHRTGKAEKCTFCYPRIEVGLPTVCSETCVGRLRYIGLFLYDVDRVTAAASVENEHDLYEAQLDLLLDPNDPAVIDQARRDGIAEDWIVAAQRSPVYKLAKDYRVALPLHPEFRTMPMVWYIPPLSPVVDRLTETGHDGEDAGNLFGAIDALRIPVEYLAELFTAGDPEPVRGVLQKLAAMRSYMRDVTLDRPRDESVATAVGMTGREIVEMYRLLAIAKYEERYVIPTAYEGEAHQLEELACSLDVDGGPGMIGSGPFGEGSGSPMPVSVETFHALRDRQTSDHIADPGERGARINLLNWDGKGRPPGLFPPPHEATAGPGDITGRSAATPSSADPDRRGRSDDQRARTGCRAPGGVGLPAVPRRHRAVDAAAGPPRGQRAAGRSPARTVDRVPRRRRGHPAHPDDPALRRGLRYAAPLLPVPHLVDRRRDPPPRQRTRRAQGALPQRRRRARHHRAARLPAGGARVRRHRRPRRLACNCFRSTGRASSCCGWPCSMPAPRTRGPSRRSARCCRGRHPPTSRRRKPWPATGHHGSRSGSSWHRSRRHRREEPDERARRTPVGRAALRDGRRAGRRHDLALPLRQVRLDHPVLGAARVAAAAHRQPAVPLRAPRRDRRARDRADHPEELDRRRRAQPGGLPRAGPAARRHRRVLHAWSGSASWSTGGAPPARCSWPPPATTS